MVILFITGGLGPGKDGVGDFTRSLAAECARLNQTCHLMALNDQHITQPVESSEVVNGISLVILRLPASLPWHKRVELAVAFRKRCAPDWISLQFVSYSFQRKGMVGNLARYFEPIIGGCALHVMFHEIWIGVLKSSSLKGKLIGKIQRCYIRRLFQQIKPRLVTTSNAFYLSLLKGIGLTAIETPLFSNIPLRPVEQGIDLPKKFIEAGFCDERGEHKNRWLGLFFGALYSDWQAEPFMGLMASALEKTGKKACLVSAGRMGGPGKILWEKLQVDYGHAVDFITLGECTEPQVSSLMYIADFGVAATQWIFIGKSSSVATMLAHGLPVIVTSYDDGASSISSPTDDPLLHRCDKTLEAKLWAGLPHRPPQHGGKNAAESLISAMKNQAKQNSSL